MTAISFYTLGTHHIGDRVAFACRLIERIRREDLRVLVYCPDATLARTLDQRLWTYRDESFLPHGLVGRVDPEFTKVLISTDGEPDGERQALVNFAREAPVFFERFARVCEIIDTRVPEQAADGRGRWSFYKERGHQLAHHRIGAAAPAVSSALGARALGG